MSTDVYSEQVPAPRRRQPAFGSEGPPPERIESAEETVSPLDLRTEALLALAIVMPVIATYGAIAYGLHLAASVL